MKSTSMSSRFSASDPGYRTRVCASLHTAAKSACLRGGGGGGVSGLLYLITTENHSGISVRRRTSLH